MTRRGFSLLETLIATGIMVVVVLAVIALSNSLIRGTVINSDKTITNRWAAEGLELATKVRDDNVLAFSVNPSGDWLRAAVRDNGADYGWYKLEDIGTPGFSKWRLQVIPGGNLNRLSKQEFIQQGEALTSDNLRGYRLICVEAVSAASQSDQDNFRCNTDVNNSAVSDGLRSPTPPCQPQDMYCSITLTSVNANKIVSDQNRRIIPAGNAVKARSVVIWEDRTEVRMSNLYTFLTNWRGIEQ